MYPQCIRCIKHILAMFRYRVCLIVSGASSVSNQMYWVYQELSGVSRGVLGISDVYKVYQTCIMCIKRILVTRALMTFYLLMCGLGFVFAIFANNKMCVLWT